MTHLTVLDGEFEAANDVNCPDDRAFPDLAEDARNAMKPVVQPCGVGAPRFLNESMALTMVHNWIADLQDVILNSDLKDRAEFHCLMTLMAGLGVSQNDLGDALEVDAKTVSRYTTGSSCPANRSDRRGVLLESYRLIQKCLSNGTLGATRHFARDLPETG